MSEVVQGEFGAQSVGESNMSVRGGAQASSTLANAIALAAKAAAMHAQRLSFRSPGSSAKQARDLLRTHLAHGGAFSKGALGLDSACLMAGVGSLCLGERRASPAVAGNTSTHVTNACQSECYVVVHLKARLAIAARPSKSAVLGRPVSAPC